MKQSKEQILQNLKDAGCTDEEITAFMKELEAGKPNKSKKVLCKCRCRVLDDLHAEQKKLECLDYLAYQMKDR